MFHFPTFPPHALCVQARVTPHDWCGVPPFGNPRINARLTAPRGLSQPPTSFIGSWCQGIHRAPLKTWPHKKPHTHPRKETSARTYTNPVLQSQKMLASTVQFSTYDQTPVTRPHQTSTPHGEHSGMRCRPALTETNEPRFPGSPLPQDPTACLRPDQPLPPRSTRHRGDAVLGAAAAAGRTGQRSTLEHHPTRSAGTRDGHRSRCGRGSGPLPTRKAASAP
jgi:hypothetical protein